MARKKQKQRREEKWRQRRREDRAINALLWTCVFAIAGSAGAVWYMVVRFISGMTEWMSYTTGLIK